MQTHSPTFYWHDYETWGLSPSLDRPSQFAGIRTDMDFNVIGEPDMFYCRLNDDYLPTIEPALITGITPELTQAEGVIEAEFSRRIHHQFSQINSCVVGYNSLRFDEEFSRHLFYRNFYDPYEYTWKNAGTRWDIIDLVRATYALRPEGFNWPKNEQGHPSFRLELLTEANGISHENAHDATSDVYATIAIAKLIKQKTPKLFNYYFDLRHKNKVKELVDVRSMRPLVHVSGMFGAARNNISLVAPIVWHPVNNNAFAVVDLSQDISPLIDLSADEIRERMYTKRAELGDKIPIPLKLVHINKCPFLAIEKVLSPEDAERLSIDRQACLNNLDIIKSYKNLPEIVKKVFQFEKEFDDQGNVDTMLYDGFFSFKDKKEFEKIHQASPDELANLKLSITDERFKALFFNYRARNFPYTLTDIETEQWIKQCQKVLLPIKSDYLSDIDLFLKQYKEDERAVSIINSLKQYVSRLPMQG